MTTTFLESNWNNAKLNRDDTGYTKAPEDAPLRKKVGCFNFMVLLTFSAILCLGLHGLLFAAPATEVRRIAGPLERQAAKDQLLIEDTQTNDHTVVDMETQLKERAEKIFIEYASVGGLNKDQFSQ
jgi:hypothetical protein